MQKLNETYHFKNDSKMSIQAGKLLESPAGGAGLNASQHHTAGKIGGTHFRTIGASDSLQVDIVQPKIPDAMNRIKKKQSDKKQGSIDKKKKMLDQMEVSRA